jgi:acyl-CoA thioesterase FadM
VLEKVGRSSGYVRHELVRTEDDALICHARVRGAWLGPTRRLARIPDAMRRAAEEQAALLDRLIVPTTTEGVVEGAHSQSWLSPPVRTHSPMGLDSQAPQEAAGEVLASRRVVASEIDIFDHVNAVTYLRFFDDCRARLGSAPVQRVSLRYVREAKLGDEVDIRGWVLDDGGLGFAVCRGDEALCLARLDLAP